LGSREIGRAQRIIDRLGSGQRREDFARAVCKSFGWRRPDGGFAIDSCRLLLGRLERRGLLRLPPPLRTGGGTVRRCALPGERAHAPKPLAELADKPPADALPGERAHAPKPLVELGDTPAAGALLVRPMSEPERPWWRAQMERYHYLGRCQMVGESLCYVALLGVEPVALLGWAAAALHNRPRDEYLGWDADTRARNLPLVVNNVRFLMLPWVRVAHLASRVLGANLRRLQQDWQQCFGHRVWLAETFVDAQRFAGTCYRAANWLYLGQTLGFGRQGASYLEHGRPKRVFIYPLHKRARERLCDRDCAFEGRNRKTNAMLKLNLSALPVDGKGGLMEVLRRLPDPRQRRGKRHGVVLVMAIAVCAVLAGAQSVAAIAHWAKDQSIATLRRLGCYRTKAPSYSTISRVLAKIDAQALDRGVGEWLQQHGAKLQGQGLALDGKTLRGSADGDGKAVHLVSAVLHRSGTVIAQTRVPDKTNEIKSVQPLLDGRDIRGAVVTGDAMFTQQDIANYIVEEKKADYQLTVKDNQPTLREDIESLHLEAFPPGA